MEMVKLKNGSTEPKVAVVTFMMTIQNLIETDPIAIYELHARAKSRDHQFFSDYREKLERLALLERGGSIHDTVKNIILSAYEPAGDLDFSIVNPIASAQAA